MNNTEKEYKRQTGKVLKASSNWPKSKWLNWSWAPEPELCHVCIRPLNEFTVWIFDLKENRETSQDLYVMTVARKQLLWLRSNNKATIVSVGTFYNYTFIVCFNKQQKQSLVKVSQRWNWGWTRYIHIIDWETCPSINLKKKKRKRKGYSEIIASSTRMIDQCNTRDSNIHSH